MAISPLSGKPKAPSIPRIKIAQKPAKVGTIACGTVSELIAAADMIARGWDVYIPLVRNRGHDLIASGNGTVITVEVRSGDTWPSGKLKYNKLPRKLPSMHFAIVTIDRPVEYDPPLPELTLIAAMPEACAEIIGKAS